MFSLKSRKRARERAVADESAFLERRFNERRPVFKEAILELEDYWKVRAVIKDLSPRGAFVAFSARVDLPFRLVLVEPTLNLRYWARVVWQNDGAAGLEFLEQD